MAPFTFPHLFYFSLLLPLFISCTASSSPFHPKALVIPVTKDTSTNQYTLKIKQRTPFVSLPLSLDLGGPFLWADCDRAYVSSTYRPARCGSAQCSLANSQSCGTCNAPSRPGCNNNTCGLSPANPFTNTATGGDLGSDVVQIQSTDGSKPGRSVTVPNILFVCAPTFLLKGLAKGSQGIAGLGRTKISLPSQFSSALSISQKFAICLSSTSTPGVIFFGGGPYKFVFSPIVLDITTVLSYTPLLINPVSTAPVYSTGETSTEYFIGVTSIKVNNITVPINKSLLTFDKKGNGGTKISTVEPYTALQTSIYKAVTDLFTKELIMGNRTKSVAPFEICYDPNSLAYSRMGPATPFIDLVFQSKDVHWIVSSTNLMVRIGNAYCLGLIDGGASPRTAIVIGAYQLQDNLLEFDLARSRLGFSSSLLFQMNRCDNFNFTSN